MRLLGLLLIVSSVGHAQEPEAFLIGRDGAAVTVRRLTTFPPPEGTRGLVVWSAGRVDRWAVLTDANAATFDPESPSVSTWAESTGATRGSGGGSSDGSLAPATTIALLPAVLSDRPRGGEVVTPHNSSVVYHRTPTLRRLGDMPGAPSAKTYPATTATLENLGRNDRTAVAFPAGAIGVPLPKLDAGTRYRLTLPNATPITFTTATDAEQAALMPSRDRLPDDAQLRLFLEVEALLSLGSDKGIPRQSSDVLDLLEAAEKPTPYLTALATKLRDQLNTMAAGGNVPKDAAPPAEEPTGIPAVDGVRALLLAGRYREAETALDAVADGSDRPGRLKLLYRAVLTAEGGAAETDGANAWFEQALEATPASEPADRLRVLVNFGHFLHRTAQDRLNDHAFRMAAGVDRPLVSVLRDWLGAADHYHAAEKLPLTPTQAAALQLDQARLSSLLADFITTLNERGQATDLVKAAQQQAFTTATRASVSAPAGSVDRGIAFELQAQLCLRAGDFVGAITFADRAREQFLASGFLPGLESICRIRGQAAAIKPDPSEAITYLTASNAFAEVLQARLPADNVGRTRAGFLARRAFVLDLMTELYIRKGDSAAALRIAEQAKARALTDVLFAGNVREKAPRTVDPLADWPASTIAVEYLFGREKAWAFLVTAQGVKTIELREPDGTLLRPAPFLADVRIFLAEMEQYNRKMATRLMNDRGIDNTWQNRLHRFRQVLLPDAVMIELRKHSTVIVVPQHVLHYLPFNALVVTLGADPGKNGVAEPKFLLDEPFVVAPVPSLTSWASRRAESKTPFAAVARAVGLVQAPGEAALKGVEADMTNFQAAFGSRIKTILREDQATAGKLLPLLDQPGLAMVGTHGHNEADQPLDSYIILLPDADHSDGRLRAREVFGRRIRADVVLLSACYTGLADRSPMPGDDLFGLQRAFLQGGAKVVVSGLWDVYDATAPELMRGCLLRVAAGKPVVEALRDAQRDFLAQYRGKPGLQPYKHPYFWAVLSAVGDPNVRMATLK